MFEKQLVKFILENALQFEWSIQGFGMLRLNLPEDVRLHVWSKAHAVPNVSLIHTHPWEFKSEVIVGEIIDTTYDDECFENDRGALPYQTRVIKPGVGLKHLTEPKDVWLKVKSSTSCLEGNIYSLSKSKIHSSQFLDGTITVVKRRRSGPDEASVYWPKGENWVSGEPRKAHKDEIQEITQNSLKRYF